MVYTNDVLESLVPITQFNRGQASRIVNDFTSRLNANLILRVRSIFLPAHLL